MSSLELCVLTFGDGPSYFASIHFLICINAFRHSKKSKNWPNVAKLLCNEPKKRRTTAWWCAHSKYLHNCVIHQSIFERKLDISHSHFNELVFSFLRLQLYANKFAFYERALFLNLLISYEISFFSLDCSFFFFFFFSIQFVCMRVFIALFAQFRWENSIPRMDGLDNTFGKEQCFIFRKNVICNLKCVFHGANFLMCMNVRVCVCVCLCQIPMSVQQKWYDGYRNKSNPIESE